jgi:hypothetical protein
MWGSNILEHFLIGAKSFDDESALKISNQWKNATSTLYSTSLKEQALSLVFLTNGKN